MTTTQPSTLSSAQSSAAPRGTAVHTSAATMTSVPLQVVKRDGRTLDFQPERITAALRKAFAAVHGQHPSAEHSSSPHAPAPRSGDAPAQADPRIGPLTERIIAELTSRQGAVKIYEIQSAVEHELLAAGEYEVARAYIDYRVQRDFARARATDLNHTISTLLDKDQAVVNENANKDADVFNTQRDLTAGMVGKAIGLRLLPAHVANAHTKGDIHVHDLDYQPYAPMTNCCLIDVPEMFAHGFRMGNAEIEPPRSIQTATAQISQIIANVSSSQYGGCTVDRIDEVLAPYSARNFDKHLAHARQWIEDPAKHEDYARERTRKDIEDAMQSLEYEINTLFTSNGQTPFTSVGFGLGTGWHEREIQKAILRIRLRGLGKEGRTAIFPKLLFTLRRGVNLEPSDPNYDVKELAVACATERMYPDVLSYDKITELTGSFKAPMGCRSFLQGWTDSDGKDVVNGRMNLGVVTLNLPRIALEANGNLEAFWDLLEQRLVTVRDALNYRIGRCKEAVPANAPILYVHGAFGQRLAVEDDVDDLFRDGRATISLGYIGLYEVAAAFYGGAWEDNHEAKELTLAVLRRLADAAAQWKAESGYHFSVYSTPSESLTDRFCRMDRERFGAVPDITDKDYYTNSFHYDVRKNPTPFEKLDFEAPYPEYASGGFIHYVEYPVLRTNPKALEAVWDYAYDRVGYLGTNTPIDRCYACGYTGDFDPTARGFACPECGNDDPRTCDVVKRTCGYLGNPQQRPMVHGRHEEIAARVKHMPGSVRARAGRADAGAGSPADGE